MVHNVIEDGGKKIIESFIAEDSSTHSSLFYKKIVGPREIFPLATGNIV